MPSARGRLIYQIFRLLAPRTDKKTSIEQQRANLEGVAKFQRMPPGIEVQPANASDIAVEWLRPTGTGDGRAILFFHGGSYTMGTFNTSRPFAALVAHASKTPTVLFQYRLAPEHPYPAALEDATATYRWLVTQGISPHNVIFAGESAGGGIAMATAVSLRDQGDPLPAAIVCLSPWVDLGLTGESITTRARADPMMNWMRLQSNAARYVGQNDPHSPLISPIYADLHGLPPMLIQVGDHETLLSDSVRLADRARQAGVDVTLEVWEGMWHVWQSFGGLVPEGKQAMDKIAAFICKHVG